MTNSYLIGYHFLASYNTIEGWILHTSQNHRLIPSPSQWSSANPRNREQRRPCTETFMHFSPGRATKFSPHTLLIFTLPQLLSKCMATGAYRAKNPLGENMHTKWNIKQNFIRHVYHLISPPRSFTLFLPVRELLEDIISCCPRIHVNLSPKPQPLTTLVNKIESIISNWLSNLKKFGRK